MADDLDALADAPRILPPLGDVNRPFWTGGARGELLIQRCQSCDRYQHPPASRCLECGGEVEAVAVSGRGAVYTFTVNRHPFNPAVPVPYVIAIVELAEQQDLRVPTNLVNCDPDALEVGMPVHVLFEDRGEIFVPVFAPD